MFWLRLLFTNKVKKSKSLLNHTWACLAMDQTGPTQNLKKKKISKSTPTFLFFKLHQSLFITIQIKKIITKQKILFFYTKYFYFFPHINQIYYTTTVSIYFLKFNLLSNTPTKTSMREIFVSIALGIENGGKADGYRLLP
jgi:hypothetical protein